MERPLLAPERKPQRQGRSTIFGVCEYPTKIYGAGIISSFGETNHIYDSKTAIYPFELNKVLGNSFINSEIQGHYYKIGDLESVYSISFENIA
jgi:phenylalanine-4-hydroxylase